MRTVVVTSLVPTVDLALQLRCLAAWSALGITARTANSERECDQLDQIGADAPLTLPIPPRETALDTHQIPTPRVVPLLRRIAAEYPDHRLLLTRPGVYPAMRTPDCIDHWLDIAPALALTTQTPGLLECYHFADHAPCHSQVDAFLLHPSQILSVAKALDDWPIAQDMCLGDAGWDLLLAAVIASPAIGGTILDSTTLLREVGSGQPPERHAMTPFVPALRALGMAEAPDPLGAAEDCARTIAAHCANHKEQTAQIKAFYFAAVPPIPAPPQSIAIAREMIEIVPWVGWNYDLTIMSSLATRIAQGGFGFDRIMACLINGPSPHHQISDTLLGMLIWARCQPRAARSLQPNYDTAPALAQGQKQTLNQLQINAPDTSLTAQRLTVITKIARDMIDHRIWPAAMQDAVVLCCQNDTDRLMFDALTAATRKNADAA